jgi:hypothetical protein
VKRVETPLGPKEAENRKESGERERRGRRTRAAILATEAQIQFWQLQTKAKTKTLADARNMAAAIGQNIRKAGQEKIALDESLRRAEQRLRDMEAERTALPDRRKATWQITASLSGTTAREQTLMVTYHMGGCGWTPSYRIEARPGEGKSWDVLRRELRQASGQDWKDVQVMLAFSDPLKGPATAKTVAAPPEKREKSTQGGGGKESRRTARKRITPVPADLASAPCATGACGPWTLGKTDIRGRSRHKEHTLKTGDESFLYLMESPGGKPVLRSEGRRACTDRCRRVPPVHDRRRRHGTRAYPEQGGRTFTFGEDPGSPCAPAAGQTFEVNNGRPEPIRLLWRDERRETEILSIQPGASAALPPPFPAPPESAGEKPRVPAPASEARK